MWRMADIRADDFYKLIYEIFLTSKRTIVGTWYYTFASFFYISFAAKSYSSKSYLTLRLSSREFVGIKKPLKYPLK
jgi:hypothetical protein